MRATSDSGSARSREAPRASKARGGETTRREQNKIDKLQRIKRAARELFVSLGYDDTTTREIAIRADIALGTIFTYAENKRDLLFLIANDDLESAAIKAKSVVRTDASLNDNLCAIFRIHYELFARQPALARLVLRELLFYDSGRQAERALAIRLQLLGTIVDAVRLAQEQEEISSTIDPTDAAWAAFGLYQAEIRRWLTRRSPSTADGVRKLRKSLQLLKSGLKSA